MRSFDEYSTAYEHVAMRREDGILELTLHSEGGSLHWGSAPHTELGYCFADVGSDPENRIIILTGTVKFIRFVGSHPLPREKPFPQEA